MSKLSEKQTCGAALDESKEEPESSESFVAISDRASGKHIHLTAADAMRVWLLGITSLLAIGVTIATCLGAPGAQGVHATIFSLFSAILGYLFGQSQAQRRH